jgi:hypothetical protein
MNIENKIRIFAGFMVVVSSVLGYLVHKYWLFLTMFVGLNLFQFGFTGFCPLEKLLLKIEKNKKTKHKR